MMADPYEDFNMTMAFAPNKYKQPALNQYSRNVDQSAGNGGKAKAFGSGLWDGAVNTMSHFVDAANNTAQGVMTIGHGVGKGILDYLHGTPMGATMTMDSEGQFHPEAMADVTTDQMVNNTLTDAQHRRAQNQLDAYAMKAHNLAHQGNDYAQKYWSGMYNDKRNVAGVPAGIAEAGANLTTTLVPLIGGSGKTFEAAQLVSNPLARLGINATATGAWAYPFADKWFGITSDAQGKDRPWAKVTDATNKVLGTKIPYGAIARTSRTAAPATVAALWPGYYAIQAPVLNMMQGAPEAQLVGSYAGAAKKDPGLFPASTAVKPYIQDTAKGAYDLAVQQGKVPTAVQYYVDRAMKNVPWWNEPSRMPADRVARITGAYPSASTPSGLLHTVWPEQTRAQQFANAGQGMYAASNRAGGIPASAVQGGISRINTGAAMVDKFVQNRQHTPVRQPTGYQELAQ